VYCIAGKIDTASIDAYLAADKDYKLQPDRKNNYSMLTIEELNIASFVGSDKDEILSSDYPFARTTPSCKEEVLLLQGLTLGLEHL
jgi:hypothetical protein